MPDPNPGNSDRGFYWNYNSSRAVITPVPDPNPGNSDQGIYWNYNSSRREHKLAKVDLLLGYSQFGKYEIVPFSLTNIGSFICVHT